MGESQELENVSNAMCDTTRELKKVDKALDELFEESIKFNKVATSVEKKIALIRKAMR